MTTCVFVYVCMVCSQVSLCVHMCHCVPMWETKGHGHRLPPYECERPEGFGSHLLPFLCFHSNFWDKFSSLALELIDRVGLLVSKFWDLPVSSLPSCLQCWSYSAAAQLFLCMLRIQTRALLFRPAIHLPSLHQLFLMKYGWPYL